MTEKSMDEKLLVTKNPLGFAVSPLSKGERTAHLNKWIQNRIPRLKPRNDSTLNLLFLYICI